MSTNEDNLGLGSDDKTNPYLPPVANLDVIPPEKLESQFPDASNGKRFLNWLIDHIGIYACAAMVGVVIGVSEKLGMMYGWLDRLGNLSGLENILFTAAITIAYYTGFEGVFGRTLGKLVTGTKVITDEGTKARFPQVIGRTFARYIPFDGLSFVIGEGGGWHDRLSGTRVVDLRDIAGRDAMARLSPQLARLYRK